MASVIRGDDNFDSSDVGPSTTYNAVGTYTMARTASSGTYGRVPARTRAGSGLHPCDCLRDFNSSYTLAGTWRLMGYTHYDNRGAVYVRIS